MFSPAAFAIQNNFTIDLLPPLDFRKINDQSFTNFVCIQKKPQTQLNEIPRENAPTSHVRDPHLLVLTVSGLLFVLFVLLILLLVFLLRLAAAAVFATDAAFGPPTVEPLPPTFAFQLEPFDLNQLRQNLPVSHRISTELLPPPHHPSAHLLALICLGLAPRIRASPLLTFQNVCAAFVVFCAVFAIVCCCLMLAFLVVCCFSCGSCCF